MRRVEIVGVMGAGKTTLARALAMRFDWMLVTESLAARTCLNNWIANPSTSVMPVQAEFYLTWLSDVLSAKTCDRVVILDHALAGHHGIYTRAFVANGDLNPEEHQALNTLAQAVLRSVGPPTVVLALEISSEEAALRLKDRPLGRDHPSHLPKMQEYCHYAQDGVGLYSCPVVHVKQEDFWRTDITWQVSDRLAEEIWRLSL